MGVFFLVGFWPLGLLKMMIIEEGNDDLICNWLEVFDLSGNAGFYFVKCGELLDLWKSEGIKCNYLSICNILVPRVLKTKIERSCVMFLSKYHVLALKQQNHMRSSVFSLGWNLKVLLLSSFFTASLLHHFNFLLEFLERIAIFHEQPFSFQKHFIWGPGKWHNP